jgi:hypothetical protein
MNATRMSGGVFPALGIAPLMGRVLTRRIVGSRELRDFAGFGGH